MNFSISTFMQSGSIMSLPSNKLLIGWGKCNKKKSNQLSPQSPAFYVNDFFLSDQCPWVEFDSFAEVSVDELLSSLSQASLISTSLPLSWSLPNEFNFKNRFDSLLQLIHSNLLTKAVPYVFIESNQKMHPSFLLRAIKKALKINQNHPGYLYGFWNESEGVFGLTPEILFSHSSAQPLCIHTMALAGTCSTSQDLQVFKIDPKELHEHQIVVEGICQSLQSMGTPHCKDLQILQLPRLSRLLTPIEIQLNSPFHFDEFVKKLHPTPALGAYPVGEGQKWLREFQSHTPRKHYGAPIGFHYPSKGLSSCFVGIRNFQWNKEKIFIGAGCGVVKESVFENEWNEIQLKLQSIKEQFQ